MLIHAIRILLVILFLLPGTILPGASIKAADTTVPAADRSATEATPAAVELDIVAGLLPCIWTGVETIVAVGDVHGDFDRFVEILRQAEIIDSGNHWIGGKTHMVQTGDVLDRGPDSKKAMDLLMNLEREASRHGGAVHALIGNHEAMVMQNDLRYVHAGETESHGGEAGYRANMASDGTYGSWIAGHNAVIRINDTVFVHGGIGPKYAAIPMEAINLRVREELRQPQKERPDSYIGDSEGPLWYRGYAEKTEEEIGQLLPQVLKSLGASRMVIGHTVSKDGIVSRCDGDIVMIDVGLSRAYDGKPACLRIRGDKLEVIELESVHPLMELEAVAVR